MATADLTARVEQAVRLILAARAGLGDPGLEPRRAVERQLREAHRVLSAYQASIGGGHSVVLRSAQAVDGWRADRAQVVALVGEWDGLSGTAPSAAAREAYRLGADWLRDGSGYEVPGAVVMQRKARPGSRVLPLPTIDVGLERAQADLAQHVAKLESELAAFEREADTVMASVE